ncbi:thioredoxin family protein [Oceanirhabdus seepicola]|uniref:TM0996/MTH895 family glutaredoxin-like protein n=1 Tax=Oceanirhabdus seepicola TaxID=2828781 RepID=A0A9J6P0H3_9CLOT|nr:thioredoxin family protein [Oceanirhabdus seepicola]MCM1988936.1 TM0996/MTH895 family glutaredoxin-like protein [Oceanirhabdus seepicola]
MIIKILGEGCSKCDEQLKNVEKAIEELGLEADIQKVEDFREIVVYGVMSTPALVVDEVVKSSGRVLSVKEVKKYL